MIIFTIIYFISCIVYLILGILVLLNDMKNKLNRIFFVMCINLASWAIMFALQNRALDAETVSIIHKYSTFSWGTVHCILLNYIMILAKKENILKKHFNYLILYFPGFASIYLYFFKPPAAQDFVQTSLGWVVIRKTSSGFIWDNFFTIYYFLYMAAIIACLFSWYKKSKIARERKQSKLILSTLLIAIIVGGITDIILPILSLTIIPSVGVILVLIPIIGIWYSIKKYKLMDLNPENIALDILKIMNEGLIIVNHEGIIKEINNGALKLLGYEKNQLIDKSIHVLFTPEIEALKLISCSSLEAELVKNNSDRLSVVLSSAVLKDKWGDSLGLVAIFQDISEIKNVQKELIKSHDELEIKIKERTTDLIKANNELKSEISTRIIMEEKIKTLANYDHLTGLPNRRLFNDKLKQAICYSAQNEKILVVLFLDLDSFKRVNDTMGHAQGDELLKKVAKRLKNVLRENDTIGRVGGDEFLILIESLEDEKFINITTERILSSFKEYFTINNHDLYITTSIGGAIYPIDGEDVETLIKNADIAMYKAKEEGKNKFELCTPLIKNNVAKEMKLTNKLYHALERDELELYYQPQVSSVSGEIIGLEALIRWNNSELGFISPKDFISIAEKTGLIVPIGEWVLRRACIQNKTWQDKGILNVPIAVNFSVNQFQNNKAAQLVSKILKETELNPKDLEIEITESIIMKETESIVGELKQLKQLGVKIAIDDFGTEYSSLNYLKELPVDRIKIDISFIRGINKNHKDEAIIKVIIGLAKNLGLQVIAEGVENKEQLDFLSNHNCNQIQGYYYYKPMSANEIEKI